MLEEEEWGDLLAGTPGRAEGSQNPESRGLHHDSSLLYPKPQDFGAYLCTCC